MGKKKGENASFFLPLQARIQTAEPAAALLLVSDQPMTPEGIKTAESDKQIDETYVNDHLKIGIASLKQLINKGVTVKHLKF